MPFLKTDQKNIKKMNRNAVYRFLYKKEAQSKQDIAYGLHLSLPTVTQNLNELIALGLAAETGEFESTGGRKAKAVELSYTAKYAIGLDVTKNHVGVVIIDLGCNVIHFKRHRLPFRPESAYFKAVGDLIDHAIKQADIDPVKILGVGIGLPAILSEDRQSVTYGQIIDFTNGSIQQFSEFIGYPCILYNDANAAGFAEIWHRGNAENIIYISLSNSVGGAVLIGGNICYGDNQRAGEVGHITIRPDGPVCYCGQRGCLDALCNAKMLADKTDGKLEVFFEHLEKNGLYTQEWSCYLDHIALAVNTLRMIMDSRIVLGGYVGAFMENHIHVLRERVSKLNPFSNDSSYLDVCTYKFEATAVGSALHYINAFIENI